MRMHLNSDEKRDYNRLTSDQKRDYKQLRQDRFLLHDQAIKALTQEPEEAKKEMEARFGKETIAKVLAFVENYLRGKNGGL